jgi:hypothetical protein
MKYCKAGAKENKKTGVLWSDVQDKIRDFGSRKIFLKCNVPAAARP